MADALTPLWWLEKLEAELTARSADLDLMDRYYNGDHPLPFVTQAHNAKMRNEFATLLADSRSNFCRLVVDAVEERLRVEGFRLSAAQDERADQESWDIWQANQMDAESQTAFVESLIMGVSYLSIWEGDPYPTIAVEDARQTIVGYVPGSNFRRRAAALKLWRDDWTGEDRANVYLPDAIYKFVRAASDEEPRATVTGSEDTFGGGGAPVTTLSTSRASPAWRESEDERVQNKLKVVPIVPLRNRPRLLLEGESELADTYRVQNQINGLLFLLALAGYFGAHRQRWATGLTLMEDANGKPVEPYDVAIDRLWTHENPNVKFGEFSQTDLGGYIKAIEQKVLHIAVTTRTPRHYLIEQGQSPSGDAIKSAESGIVKKAERKQRPFGEGLEEAMRIARRFAGSTNSPVDSEIVWADPATPTQAETTDAVIKQFQADLIPWEAAVAKLGFSQTEIARFTAMRESESAAATPTEEAVQEKLGLTAQQFGLAVRGGILSQEEARAILRKRFGVDLDQALPEVVG